MSRTVRTLVVLGTAIVAQQLVVSAITIAGARVDLMIVVAAAAGVAGGPDRGAAVGFAAGLLTDLTIDGPFGLSALLYAVAASTLGSVQRSWVGPSAWVGVAGVSLAAAFSVVGYVALGAVLGHPEWVDGHALNVLLVVTLGAAVLAPVAIPIMRWTEGEPLGWSLPQAFRPTARRSSRRTTLMGRR